MHGRGGSTRTAELPVARQACRGVLNGQINLLRPRLIIASGACAVDSLRELGLLRKRWGHFNGMLGLGPYVETSRLKNGDDVTVAVTYHTAGKVINMTVSNLYGPETERLLGAEIDDLGNPPPLLSFLQTLPPDAKPGMGMRVLLLHWLKIGRILRSMHGET